MLNVWRHNFDVIFLATFEIFSMHVFYKVLERAHQGELKAKQILSFSQKLIEICYF